MFPMKTKTPCMSDAEIRLFSSQIEKSNKLLEFGCGGSTLHALTINQNIQITSIETDLAFIDNIKIELDKNQNCKNRYSLVYADIGEIEAWGTPANKNATFKWLNYTFKIWPNLSDNYDLILIDGRFRLCTSLLSLIYKPDILYLFHDFTIRSYYSPLLKYIDVKEVVDTMIVYRRKAQIDCSQILAEASKCMFDYR